MGTRKCILVSSVLVIWLISGYSAHSLASGRSAKILEDPVVPQAAGSYEVVSKSDSKGTAVQDTSDRSLSYENNMMLYRSVFTLSLKLLTVFLVVKLLTGGLTSAGLLRPNRPVPIVPFPGQQGQVHTVDVNYNPGLALHQGSTIAAGNTGNAGAGNVLLTTANAGSIHSISTGAAAGASTGTAPAHGGYLTASTQQRPNYLPLGPPPPRFRLFGLGGPRHPPLRRPPPAYMMPHSYAPVTQHNMAHETQYVDTHTHLLVMPDGTQARVPNIQTVAAPQAAPVASQATITTSASSSSSSSSTSPQDSKSSASSDSETATTSAETTVNVSTSSNRNGAAAAERRSSNVFRDKQSSSYLHQLQHQPYDDWNLHFSPGT